jgi:hypothetical protein
VVESASRRLEKSVSSICSKLARPIMSPSLRPAGLPARTIGENAYERAYDAARPGLRRRAGFPPQPSHAPVIAP